MTDCIANSGDIRRGRQTHRLRPIQNGYRLFSCVYRIFDSAWTYRTDGVSLRPDEGSVQADSRRTGFALHVESKAGSRNLDPTATDQCASPPGTKTTAPQQYRSFSVCLALSLVPLRPWRDCDCQAGDDHSLAHTAPRRWRWDASDTRGERGSSQLSEGLRGPQRQYCGTAANHRDVEAPERCRQPAWVLSDQPVTGKAGNNSAAYHHDEQDYSGYANAGTVFS